MRVRPRTGTKRQAGTDEARRRLNGSGRRGGSTGDARAQVADLNGDGSDDVLLYDPATGVWYQALTTTPGTFRYTNGQFGS